MAPMRVLAPALLLLTACEGGSTGGNTAAEESAGQPVVQQGVPENLTDDPRNAAVPLDSLAYRFDIVLRGSRQTVFENKMQGA